MVSEVILQHLIQKNFLGGAYPQTPLAHTYMQASPTLTQPHPLSQPGGGGMRDYVGPPNSKCLPPPLILN